MDDIQPTTTQVFTCVHTQVNSSASPQIWEKISKWSLKTRMVPQILGGQAWWPSTIQQMIIYAAFFPSDHTSRQMIKTIALFPRTLILMHYTTAATLHNGEFLPIDIQATYLFFRWKLILSVQGRLSLHLTSFVMRYAMATFINIL